MLAIPLTTKKGFRDTKNENDRKTSDMFINSQTSRLYASLLVID